MPLAEIASQPLPLYFWDPPSAARRPLPKTQKKKKTTGTDRRDATSNITYYMYQSSMAGISGSSSGVGRKRPLRTSSAAHHVGVVPATADQPATTSLPLPSTFLLSSATCLRRLVPGLALVAVILQSAVFISQPTGDQDYGSIAGNGKTSRLSRRSATQHMSHPKQPKDWRRKLSDVPSVPLQDLDAKDDEDSANQSIFPSSMNKLVTRMAIVSRRQFARVFDTGYALDKKKKGGGNEKVLILYANPEGNETASDGTTVQNSPQIEEITVDDVALQCKTVKVVLTDANPKSGECIAIQGQWASNHVHKFKRKKIKRTKSEKEREKELGIDSDEDLYTFRYSSGRKMILPTADQQEANRRILLMYLKYYPDALEKLRPIAELASRGGSMEGDKMPVIILLSNYGQSKFLLNYVCSARARGIDLSRVVLFATDKETQELGEALRLSVFYDEMIFGFFPKDAAKNYHDISYALIMMTKVFSVHLVNALGHDLLFSDVDIALYKDPFEYFFQQPSEFDAFFQHDGYHHPTRFAPLAANTGFYYVQNNERTRYFFSLFMRMGDLVIMERSHQAALTTLINEQMSLHGLRVKVLGEDHKLFMSGYHYHADKKLLRKLKEGRHEPYLFHANWLPGNEKMPVLMETSNWFVHEQCVDRSFEDLKLSLNDLNVDCCLAGAVPYIKSGDEGEAAMGKDADGQGSGSDFADENNLPPSLSNEAQSEEMEER